jgi:GDP-L-fucose synthase
MSILITGSGGMLGSYINFGLKPSKSELDYKDYDDLCRYIEKNEISQIIHCAAKVGGVSANSKYPYDFFMENALINLNILRACAEYKLNDTILLLSICVFPNYDDKPITESDLHTAEPHATNLGYGYAKRMLDIGARCVYNQYGVKVKRIVPCNMYGMYDNFDLENSHVIPGLIHKCFVAKQKREDFIIWGSGEAEREFVYAADVADIIKNMCYRQNDTSDLMIISPKNTVRIKHIVQLISEYMEFSGNIIFDKTKPEGAKRRSSDNSVFKSYFPEYEFTSIEQGIKETVNYFISNYPNIRI